MSFDPLVKQELQIENSCLTWASLILSSLSVAVAGEIHLSTFMVLAAAAAELLPFQLQQRSRTG